MATPLTAMRSSSSSQDFKLEEVTTGCVSFLSKFLSRFILQTQEQSSLTVGMMSIACKFQSKRKKPDLVVSPVEMNL